MAPPKDPRNEHYVPRFYLEGFRDPSFTKPKLWVYEQGRPIRISTPKNEGYRRDYYTFKARGKRRFEFEHALGQFETPASAALHRVRTSGYVIGPTEKELIAQLLGLMFSRVPAFRDFVDREFRRVTRGEGQRIASDLTELGKVARYVEGRTGRPVDLEQLREAILRYDASPPAIFNLAEVVRVGMHLAPVFWAMDWHILKPGRDQSFITSDNPIVTYRDDGTQVLLGEGFGRDGVQVFFPLSREACLVMTRAHYRVTAPSAVARSINKSLMRVATRFVYASEKSEKLDEVFQRIGCAHVYGEDVFLPSSTRRAVQR